MTQSELQVRSKVSRSYLSRIEGGQMTPSIGTLEKVSEALGVGLNQFFMPESEGEGLLRDPFIQGLRPFLCQLEWTQWQALLKRLHAIGAHVNKPLAMLRPIGKQTTNRQPQRHNLTGHIGAGHLEESNDRLDRHSRCSPSSVATASSKR
jgi:transcriptional regulator with XRE-family HTH domain